MRRRLLATCALAAAVLTAAAAPATFERGRVLVVRADAVAVWFEVEIAASPAARRQGLMHREALPARHGMWFDFGRATAVTMWMKNTLIPLDMVFVDAGGHVIAVAEHTTPGSLEKIPSPAPARYVLELNAGAAARYGLAPGALVLCLRSAVNAASKPSSDSGTPIDWPSPS